MKKNKLSPMLLLCLIFVLASLVCNLLISFTSFFKLDSISYNINNYNKNVLSSNFKAPYLKISSKKSTKSLYNDLFQTFYYSDDSGSIRQYFDNDIFYNFEGQQKNVRLYTQEKLYISPEKQIDDGYRLDYGLFHAYFSSNELGSYSYLGKRFDCDTYMFVSDKFADMLLFKYGLIGKDDDGDHSELYKELMFNEKYSVVHFSVDGTDFTVSINNILYTKNRTGPRCSEFNELFAVVNHHYALDKYPDFNICIEIDLKAYSYYIKTALNKVESFGYNVKDNGFDFYQYDYSNKEYYKNDQIANLYNSYRAVSPFQNCILITFYVLIGGFAIVASIIISKRGFLTKKNVIFVICFEFTIAMLFSILASLIFVSYLYSIIMIALLIAFIIQKGGTIIHVKLFEKNVSAHLDHECYYFIKI